jgi:polysaccharide export outer membrane protein|uniref:polysaccharide biosynthesis/export family protein n=1 Tax=Prosthecobacter sp. TaxID=1965333 RepID=UPI003784DFD6
MPRRSTFYTLLCSLLLASATRGEEKALEPPVKALTGMDALDNVKKIEVGNLITIQILEDKRDAVQQYVAVSGEIQAPYLGLTKAVSLTCRTLAYQLKNGLEKGFFKEATVTVTCDFKPHKCEDCSLEFDYSTVVALGNVSKTGKYLLPEDTDLSVTGLLELAGGTISKKKIPAIVIIRRTPQGNKRILVNTEAALIEKRREYDLFLRRDDVVIVE